MTLIFGNISQWKKISKNFWVLFVGKKCHIFQYVSQLKDSYVGELQKNGAFVRVKKSDYLMHHKFAIIDGKNLITGSFNWTMQAAMGNYENVLITNVI